MPENKKPEQRKSPDIQPIDILAYPLALGYLGLKGLYNVGAFIWDVGMGILDAGFSYALPGPTQKFKQGARWLKEKTIDSMKNLPPEKAFGAVAATSVLAYGISPVVGFAMLYSNSSFIVSMGVAMPKALKVLGSYVNYLCWENASKSESFKKVKKYYDPFAEAVSDTIKAIKKTADFTDNVARKSLPGYEKSRSLFVAAKNYSFGTPEERAMRKKYKNKMAKMLSAILPGYRRADEIQDWVTRHTMLRKIFGEIANDNRSDTNAPDNQEALKAGKTNSAAQEPIEAPVFGDTPDMNGNWEQNVRAANDDNKAGDETAAKQDKTKPAASETGYDRKPL